MHWNGLGLRLNPEVTQVPEDVRGFQAAVAFG